MLLLHCYLDQCHIIYFFNIRYMLLFFNTQEKKRDSEASKNKLTKKVRKDKNDENIISSEKNDRMQCLLTRVKYLIYDKIL
jgi:hypothetical protein